MVLTASTMMSLGTKAPDFTLPEVVQGNTFSLSAYHGKKAILVVFICRHCPYVVHVKDQLSQLGKDYANKDIGLVAVSANDAEKYPDDAPASLKAFSEAESFTFPFCYDQTQDVAKAYSAACTPDFFLFDKNQQLVYRGQLDESRPESGKPVTGKDLRAAIDAVLSDQPVSQEQRPSMGCNIKWKPGNEPNYFKGK